jgi:hypothetical protein
MFRLWAVQGQLPQDLYREHVHLVSRPGVDQFSSWVGFHISLDLARKRGYFFLQTRTGKNDEKH